MIKRMKKTILFLFSLVLSLFFYSSYSVVHASEVYCTPDALYCSVAKYKCKEQGFDCENYLYRLTEEECAAQNGCYEMQLCNYGGGLITNEKCFLPKDDPTPKEECGYIGRVCCGNIGNWSCPNSGVPDIKSETECTCKESPTKPVSLLQPSCCRTDTNEDVSCSAFDKSLGVALPENYKGIQTALGCFPTQPKAIVEWILKYALMLAGTIGFLLMLYASFQIITSAGDPDKLKAGQQMLTGAIVGILIIVFAIFILRYLGVTILHIPGWS